VGGFRGALSLGAWVSLAALIALQSEGSYTLASPLSTPTFTPVIGQPTTPPTATAATAATIPARPTPGATSAATTAPPSANPTPVGNIILIPFTPTTARTVPAASPTPPTSTPLAATPSPTFSATPLPTPTVPFAFPLPTATALPPSAAAGSVVINELLTNPRISWDTRNPQTPMPWVELYNPFDSDADIANWSVIGGSAGMAGRKLFVPGTVVPGHGYLVIFQSDAAIDFSAGAVLLVDGSGGIVDSVAVPSLEPDQSYARLPDGASWSITASPTLGSPNVYTISATPGPDLRMTVAAIRTEVALPLPSAPATPDATEASLVDATELDAGTAPSKSRRGQTFRSLPISAIRLLPDNAAVIATGVITMPSGQFDASRAYIQAEGAGLLIHSYGRFPLKLGDVLTVKGRVHHIHGEVEVAAIKDGEQVLPGGLLPSPRVIQPAEIGPAVEALLVQVSGPVSGVENGYLTLGDANGNGRIFLYGALGLPSKQVRLGQNLTVTGVVNAADLSAGPAPAPLVFRQQRLAVRTHRLLPRDLSDVVGLEVAASPSQEGLGAATAAEGTSRSPGRQPREPGSAARSDSRAAQEPQRGEGPAAPLPTTASFSTPVSARRRAEAPAGESNEAALDDTFAAAAGRHDPLWLGLGLAAGGGVCLGLAGAWLHGRLRRRHSEAGDDGAC